MFFFLIILLPVSGFGAEPVHVGSDFIISQIGKQTDVFMDSSQNLSLFDILSEPDQQRFKPHQTTGFNFGMTSDVIWLRFKIAFSKTRDKNKKLVLVLDKTTYPIVDLYMPDGQGAASYKKILNGYLRSSPNHTWEYRYPVFNLASNMPENQYLFLRIDPKISINHSSSNFLLFLVDADSFRKITWFEISFLPEPVFSPLPD